MKKKQYIIKNCLFCHNEINKRKNEGIPDYYKRKFCKLSCQHKWNTKTNSKEIKCDFCGKILRRANNRIKKHNYCSAECQYKHKTQMHTRNVICDWCGKEYIKKLSDRKTKRIFCSRNCMGEWQAKYVIGELACNWRGGVSTINQRIRSLIKYSNWVKGVFKKDFFTCIKCGDKRGGNLNAHHIKQVSDIIEENNIKKMQDIIKSKELWNINNGITLCENCHVKIHKGNYANIKRTI